MSAPGGIPPYDERDEALAVAAIAQVVRREGEPAGLLREVAGAIATARAEGHEAGVQAALAVAAREYDAAEAIRRELLGGTS